MSRLNVILQFPFVVYRGSIWKVSWPTIDPVNHLPDAQSILDQSPPGSLWILKYFFSEKSISNAGVISNKNWCGLLNK